MSSTPVAGHDDNHVVVRAPGKLLFSGAYAVLAGFSAVVMAVDRYVTARERPATAPSGSSAHAEPVSVPMEVRAAFEGSVPPLVDTSALHAEDGSKFGLGSSAAALVAALGLRATRSGRSLTDPRVRRELLNEARRIHASAQGGGSGVDIAASVYGGLLVYGVVGGQAHANPVRWPPRVVFRAYWSGRSARTSELLAPVHRLRAFSPRIWATRISDLGEAATAAVAALEQQSALQFVAALRSHGRALAELGVAADAPLVPHAFAVLADAAVQEGAVFFPSGAGGGDVGLYVGVDAVAPNFDGIARAVGMRPIDVGVDTHGVSLVRANDTVR